MFCTNCGQAYTDNAQFCEHCGARTALGAAGPPAAPPPSAPVAPVPPGTPLTITSDDLASPPAPPVPPGPPLAPAPAGAYPDPPASKPASRGPMRLIVAGVGAVALLAVGYVLVGNLRGSGGGAGSPEGAVSNLASAISDEDAVGALAMLPPEEVRSFDDLFTEAAHQSQDAGLVESAGSPFAGLDLEVEPGDLQTEELGPDVTRVDISGTSLAYRFDPSQLTDDARQAAEDEDGEPLEASSDSERLDEDYTCYDEQTGEDKSINPFLVTVQRGGRWYVSPTYTLAEYLMACSDLPPGDFEARQSDQLHGADSPEQAVENLVDSVASADVDGAVDIMSGGGLPVLADYEDALRQVVNDNVSFNATVDGLSLDSEDLDGGRAKVAINHASVSYSWTDDDGDSTSGTLEVNGPCVTDQGETTFAYDDYYDDYSDSYDDSGCLDDAFGRAAPHDIFVVAVQQNGEWFVSPVDTALEYARALLDEGVADEVRSGDLLNGD